MWLTIGNQVTTVSMETVQEMDWLAKFLTFQDGRSRGDGFIRLLKFHEKSFPSGLVEIVKRGARDEGFDVQVIDHRSRPGGDVEAAIKAVDWAWLHDFQVEACSAALRAGRGIIEAPTGSGKGEMAVALAKCLQIPWLFMVHRGNLVSDVAERFRKRTGLEPNILHETGKVGGRLSLATFQWLHRNRDTKFVQSVFARTRGLIVDEAHIQPADSFLRVSVGVPDAYYRIGLSGTPFDRGDNRNLVSVAVLGPRVYRIEARKLIDRGLLAEPKITMLELDHPTTRGDWDTVYKTLVVKNKVRNAIIVQAVQRATKPCMCFYHLIDHGKELLRLLTKAGVKAEMVSGEQWMHQREAAVERLVRGHTDCILANVVFQEGLDVPELQDVVIASGLQTTIGTLQKVGRGMRRRDSSGREVKEQFRVFDVRDLGNTYLERHSDAREAAYTRRGYSVTRERPILPTVGRRGGAV